MTLFAYVTMCESVHNLNTLVYNYDLSFVFSSVQEQNTIENISIFVGFIDFSGIYRYFITNGYNHVL